MKDRLIYIGTQFANGYLFISIFIFGSSWFYGTQSSNSIKYELCNIDEQFGLFL